MREMQELKQREESLKHLEADIADVNQIFNEVAALVHDQGGTIDSIDGHVEDAVASVDSGSKQLEAAKINASKARKKKLLLILALLLLVIIGIIIIVVSSKKS